MQRPHPTLAPAFSKPEPQNAHSPRPVPRTAPPLAPRARGGLLGSALLACFALSACLDEAVPSDWVLHESSTRQLEEKAEDPVAARAAVSDALEALFGQARAPHWPLGDSNAPANQLLVQSAEIYRDECSHCHGLEGYGNGPSSQFLNPKPWNFSLGVFPRSAPNGGEPSLPALVELLKSGIPSSSMPKFERLGQERLQQVSGHFLLLLKRIQMEPILVEAYLSGGAEAVTPEKARELYQGWMDSRGAPGRGTQGGSKSGLLPSDEQTPSNSPSEGD